MRFGLFMKTGVAIAMLAAAVTGCGDSDDTTSTSGTTTTLTTGGAGGSGGTGGAGATGGTGGSDSGGASTGGNSGSPSFVAKLDATKGELPEGLFISNDQAYLGLAALGKVIKVDLPGGAVHDMGSIPPIPANGGFMLGIVVDATGSVLVGFGGGPGVEVKNGVYKIPAAGGAVASPFASDPEMSFPNGLLLDGADLFVADSGGALFRIAPDGTTAKWTSDPSLVGTDMSCVNGAPFPLGANGLVKMGGAFYVANTNLAQIVKIAINADGTAGAASVFAGPDCDKLGGIDGLAVDADGKSLLGVLNGQSKLVRIDTAGAVTELLVGKPLDNPASIVVEKNGAAASAYITNSAFFAAEAPEPGLLLVPLH